MTSSNKSIPEFDVLPDDHQNALSHACLEFDNHWDYKDTLYKDYHYDKWAKDNPEQTSLRFINKEISSDLRNFVREPDTSGYINDLELAQNTLWLTNMEVRKFNFSGYKQNVSKDKHPTLNKITEWLEFEHLDSAIVIQQMPTQWEIWQTPSDKLCLQIHLEDWEFGQTKMLGTKMLTQWRSGEVFIKSQLPFCSGNSSRHITYTLEITGRPSDSTLNKLNAGGDVYVK